jgi:glycosyl transferase, family 25
LTGTEGQNANTRNEKLTTLAQSGLSRQGDARFKNSWSHSAFMPAIGSHALNRASGENRSSSAIMRFSIWAMAAFCIGSTSGRPMNWRASRGVQSTSTVIFIGRGAPLLNGKRDDLARNGEYEGPLALLGPNYCRSLHSEPALSGPKAFILHLERATSRAANVQALIASMAIESEVLAAVDGAHLTPQEVDQVYARRRFRPHYPFPLRRTEVGVFLSHRAAWRRIVDEALDFAFIFEDDAQIDPSAFAALLEFVTLERQAWDYVLLPAQPIRNGTAVASRGAQALLRPDAPPLRAIAQIVSLAAAKRLLERTLPFDRPIDTLMQMTWVTGQPLLVASPSPVRDVSRETGGSTVQRKSMGFAERLRHETIRPIYRAQVLARYRRHLGR